MHDGENDDESVARQVIVAETSAAILATGTVIDRWSRLLALLTGMLMLLLLADRQPYQSSICALLSLLGALGQAYYAARVAIDAHLFACWAKRWHTRSDTANHTHRITDDLAIFDGVIDGLRGSSQQHYPAEPRDLDCRQSGALRLLRRQSVCFAMQTLVFAISLASAFWLWQPLGTPY